MKIVQVLSNINADVVDAKSARFGATIHMRVGSF